MLKKLSLLCLPLFIFIQLLVPASAQTVQLPIAEPFVSEQSGYVFIYRSNDREWELYWWVFIPAERDLFISAGDGAMSYPAQAVGFDIYTTYGKWYFKPGATGGSYRLYSCNSYGLSWKQELNITLTAHDNTYSTDITHTIPNVNMWSFKGMPYGYYCNLTQIVPLFTNEVTSATDDIYQELQSINANMSTYLFKIKGVLDNVYNLISAPVDNSSINNNDSTNESLSNSIGSYDNIESGVVDNFSSSIENIDTEISIFNNSDFVATGTWLSSQIQTLYSNDHIGLITTFSLVIGLALALIGFRLNNK